MAPRKPKDTQRALQLYSSTAGMLAMRSFRSAAEPAACFPSTSTPISSSSAAGRRGGGGGGKPRPRTRKQQLFVGRRETLATVFGAGVVSHAKEAGASEGVGGSKQHQPSPSPLPSPSALSSVYTATDQTASAVDQLIKDYGASGRSGRGCEDTFALGQGTWEVFYAPHIRNLSQGLQTEFSPIRYTLLEDNNGIRSHVRYTNALFGSGWLSASGTITAEDESTLRIHFDSFWLDKEDELREILLERGQTLEMLAPLDRAVNAIGRLGFLPAFATFPVLQVSKDYAVFRFPPLQSNIAIKRIVA